MSKSMHDAISYIEIGSGDGSGRTGAFFAELLGWRFNKMDDAGNGWFEDNGFKIGVHPDDPSPSMIVFFVVDDLEKHAERVRNLGGTANIQGEPEEGFGQFALCTDPTGVPFGLHQKDG